MTIVMPTLPLSAPMPSVDPDEWLEEEESVQDCS